MAVTSRSAVKWVQSREDHYEISLSLSHTHSNVITTNPLKLKATNHKKLDVYAMSVTFSLQPWKHVYIQMTPRVHYNSVYEGGVRLNQLINPLYWLRKICGSGPGSGSYERKSKYSRCVQTDRTGRTHGEDISGL